MYVKLIFRNKRATTLRTTELVLICFWIALQYMKVKIDHLCKRVGFFWAKMAERLEKCSIIIEKLVDSPSLTWTFSDFPSFMLTKILFGSENYDAEIPSWIGYSKLANDYSSGSQTKMKASTYEQQRILTKTRHGCKSTSPFVVDFLQVKCFKKLMNVHFNYDI